MTKNAEDFMGAASGRTRGWEKTEAGCGRAHVGERGELDASNLGAPVPMMVRAARQPAGRE
jgi:hypothetical protein